jgi:hypothetical protein
MLSSLFLSKEKKLIKQWKAEHLQIVALAGNVIASFSKNDLDATKEYLKKLTSIAVDHLMGEDIKLFEMRGGSKDNDLLVRKIAEFKESFRSVKLPLMKFLTLHSSPAAILDTEFFDKFNEIVDVLLKRIEFEEKNLYFLIER